MNGQVGKQFLKGEIMGNINHGSENRNKTRYQEEMDLKGKRHTST